MVVGPGGGGLEPRLSSCPLEELDAVVVVSCALAVVSLGPLGCEEVVFGSIPVATAANEHGKNTVANSGGKGNRGPVSLTGSGFSKTSLTIFPRKEVRARDC